MAFNIMIDACASNKDMHRARELVEEMQQARFCNLVTYNTLMKGHIAAGDMTAAKGILREMEQAGIAPDSACFSCLLSGAAKMGNLMEVWATIDEMDRRGFRPDSYAVSMVMQKVRKVQNPREAKRLLAILDRPDVRVCEDEVVLNTVLDACIHRRDRRRLARVLEERPPSKVQPTVRTHSLLIKACTRVLGFLE